MNKRTKLDVEAELRRIVLQRLPLKNPLYRTKLDALPTTDLLIRYYNWLNRLIPVRRRVVLRAKELAMSAAYARCRGDVDLLCAKIAAGFDLTPHLSTQVNIGYEEDKSGRPGRRSLDLLLSDWGIHHLHFSHQRRLDGFVERHQYKSELLFAVFRPNEAYIVGVFNHGEWTRDDIAKTMIRNWPDKNLLLHLNGALGLSQSISEADRQVLRSAHIAAPIEVDGKVFIGPNSMSSAGTTFRANMQVTNLLRNLDFYQKDECQLVLAMKANLENLGKTLNGRLAFELIEAQCEHGYGFAVREKKSGATLWVG
jgi:hypothetical protein